MSDLTERQIARRIVKAALARGWLVTVNNGGDENEIEASRNLRAILAVMGQAGEDRLYFHKCVGHVDLVYGDGQNLIADSGTGKELTDFLRPIEDWVETLPEDS